MLQEGTTPRAVPIYYKPCIVLEYNYISESWYTYFDMIWTHAFLLPKVIPVCKVLQNSRPVQSEVDQFNRIIKSWNRISGAHSANYHGSVFNFEMDQHDHLCRVLLHIKAHLYSIFLYTLSSLGQPLIQYASESFCMRKTSTLGFWVATLTQPELLFPNLIRNTWCSLPSNVCRRKHIAIF